ncbi:MAG: hypothetical protein ACO225_14670 [Ilumatobacteraceae bacterium]
MQRTTTSRPPRRATGRSATNRLGIGQRPPFRWTCPTCGQTVITHVTVSAAPTCSVHSGGGREMTATRVRFQDVP